MKVKLLVQVHFCNFLLSKININEKFNVSVKYLFSHYEETIWNNKEKKILKVNFFNGKIKRK